MRCASLCDGSDCLRASRCSRRDPARCDRAGSIAPTQTHPACPHRPALSRASKRPRCGPAGGRQPPGRVALAAALRRRRASKVCCATRRVHPARHPTDRDAGRGAGADLLRAAGRGHPLDRPGRGPGGWDLVARRAADLGRSPPPTASTAHVQALARPRLRREGRERAPIEPVRWDPGVVGLYMDPPAHAVVLSIDEKSQIQALERTRPDRPLAPRPSRRPDPRLYPS